MDHMAEINTFNKANWTPFHIACEIGNLELVKYLASIPEIFLEVEDIDKNTPLHLAAKQGNLPIVTFLISDMKVDPACVNNELKKPS